MTIMTLKIAGPDRFGTIELPDGRALGWAERGPSDGVPVLLCGGAGWSRWLGFDAPGVRLVTVDRPGLGASSPQPGRTLLDWADDVAHLVAELGLDAPRVVGFSQGAPFALACAARGIASAAAVVSGGDELAHPAFAECLPPDIRGLVDLVASDPAAAEAEFAAFGDPDTMWRLSVEGSPAVDRAVYLRPDFEAAFRRALSEGFAQGAGGYARDTVLHLSRWPFAVEDIAVPVDLWYGGQDTNPTHSPDFGATLAGRIPGARRHFLPEAGGALLWTHAEQIVQVDA
ncbi:UNVERIFIED_ORG: pimeloyl-ACP methyl ester carboxylesterase [Actinomadura viridilutea]